MRQIEFTIDPATGDLTMHVKGVAGPDCTDITTIASDLLGTPAHDWKTPEYYLRPHVQTRVRPKRSR